MSHTEVEIKTDKNGFYFLQPPLFGAHLCLHLLEDSLGGLVELRLAQPAGGDELPQDALHHALHELLLLPPLLLDALALLFLEGRVGCEELCI